MRSPRREPLAALRAGWPNADASTFVEAAGVRTHVEEWGAGDPVLLIHGDADPQMPHEQSREFASAYEALKLRAKLVSLPGSRHGGEEFYDAERSQLVAAFLNEVLK